MPATVAAVNRVLASLLVLTANLARAEGDAPEREVFIQPLMGLVAPLFDSIGTYTGYYREIPLGFALVNGDKHVGWILETTVAWEMSAFLTDEDNFASTRNDSRTLVVGVGRMLGVADAPLFIAPKVVASGSLLYSAKSPRGKTVLLPQGQASGVRFKFGLGIDVGARLRIGRFAITPIMGLLLGAAIQMGPGYTAIGAAGTVPGPFDGLQTLPGLVLLIVEPNLNLLRIGFVF